MKVSCKAIDLPFRHPFTISKGTKTHQPSLLVALGSGGLTGFGEAPAITYYDITVEKMMADLGTRRRTLEGFAFTQPERFWHFLHHLIPGNPFLVCALDMAGWDLFGKLQGVPLYRLWNADPAAGPVTDYTIGIDTIDRMVHKMNEMRWPVYKIKLGTDQDVEIIRNLRRHTEALFRIDANAAWTSREALEKIRAFADLGVEFIEQPLATGDREGMRFLFEHSPLPLIADESCVAEKDVDACHGYFHGINIKLTKCSGITPARRMIARARALGMKVMIGSMNESTVGTAAIAQLMPFVDYADADGPLLLAEDVATGIGFERGRIVYSGAPGTGISMEPF